MSDGNNIILVSSISIKKKCNEFEKFFPLSFRRILPRRFFFDCKSVAVDLFYFQIINHFIDSQFFYTPPPRHKTSSLLSVSGEV